MEVFVESNRVDALWEQCLQIDHEFADQNALTQLYQDANQALEQAKRASGSRSKIQVLDKRLKILHEWVKDADVVLS